MSEALQLHAIPPDAAPTLEDFASDHRISTRVAADVLTHKDTAAQIHEETKARALLAQSAIANRLIKILNSDDDKNAMAAAGLLLKLGGAVKSQGVQVRISFDELMKGAATVQAGRLTGITDITPSAVIDVEEMEEEDDG